MCPRAKDVADRWYPRFVVMTWPKRARVGKNHYDVSRGELLGGSTAERLVRAWILCNQPVRGRRYALWSWIWIDRRLAKTHRRLHVVDYGRWDELVGLSTSSATSLRKECRSWISFIRILWTVTHVEEEIVINRRVSWKPAFSLVKWNCVCFIQTDTIELLSSDTVGMSWEILADRVQGYP